MAAGAVVSVVTLRDFRGASDYQVMAKEVDKQVWKLQSRTYGLFHSAQRSTAWQQWLTAAETYEQAHQDLYAAGKDLPTVTARVQSIEGQSRKFHDQVLRQVEQVKAAYEDLGEDAQETAPGDISRLLASGEADLGLITMRRHLELLATILDDTESEIIQTLVTAHQQEMRQLQNERFTVFVGVAAAVLILVGLYVLFFARYLYRRIQGLRRVFDYLAEGDFTIDVPKTGRDEIGALARNVGNYIEQFAEMVRTVKSSIRESEELKETLTNTEQEYSSSVNQMTANIRSIGNQIQGLNRSLESTTGSVSDIFARIRELTSQIETQSSSVNEASSSMEEMAASIDNVAKITTARTEASNQLVEVTKTGNEKVQSTNHVVWRIAQSVQEIMDIIDIINKIAGQTNILSMNAAIEAAHAGEYGRGFSVVAEEIRELSDSTNENAKKIKQSLQEISDAVEQAEQLSTESSKSFDSIMEEVQRFTSSMQEISATTDELSSGTQEMLQTTSDLSSATVQIKEAAEHIESETKQIDESMGEIRSISQQVEQGIQEISTGTEEITQGMTHLNEISRQNSEQIDELVSIVEGFRVRDDITLRRESRDGDGSGDDGQSEPEAGAAETQPAEAGNEARADAASEAESHAVGGESAPAPAASDAESGPRDEAEEPEPVEQEPQTAEYQDTQHRGG
jgi:methyl-accepting chemotaxis protein